VQTKVPRVSFGVDVALTSEGTQKRRGLSGTAKIKAGIPTGFLKPVSC